MEDLLASIRKAIHEDIGDVPGPMAAAAGGFSGTMRELRVRSGGEVKSAASEIETIRNRIQRNREAEPPMRTISPAPLPPRPAPNAGFADILSGEGVRPSRLADYPVREEPPAFRRSRYEDEPQQQYLPPPETRLRPDPILSADTASAAGSSFNRLAENILARATGDRSIEDMTRELLRSMLKGWLDENLPGLVERLVREEIERVARRGR
jgi:uncharacterized protein